MKASCSTAKTDDKNWHLSLGTERDMMCERELKPRKVTFRLKQSHATPEMQGQV